MSYFDTTIIQGNDKCQKSPELCIQKKTLRSHKFYVLYVCDDKSGYCKVGTVTMLGAVGLRIRGLIPDRARFFHIYKTFRLVTGIHTASYEVAGHGAHQ